MTATATSASAPATTATPAVEADDLRALPAAPEPRRRNTILVATMFVIAAATMLIAGLIGGYLQARDATEAAGELWPPEGVALPNVPLLVAYLTLLMSSVTAQWAVSAIKVGARRQMFVAIGITLVLGLSFVNALSFSWTQLALVAGESPYANAVYAVSVTHLFLVLGAHVLFLVMGFRALGGQFSPRNAEFVSAAAAFWHFTVAAGAVVWWFLWFLPGGPS